ncbi:ATP-dependent RNA helicase SUV3 homolog, mitochondrial-like [Centruroides sculpturatus]|uniref:ATP-dependent RNA helicase SUV3 homolog, mitochondrial-like n=1 Tax=Centruroides sculpturatus TaxID=218467 RepID=UPI000C6E487F|nr:ATP-dependent RNA helicase SUV3 homolog, mitochondrial-like [Centruroides sculpturatus]
MANKILDKCLKCCTNKWVNKRYLSHLIWNKSIFIARSRPLLGTVRLKSQNNSNSPFVPIPLKITNNPDDINIGEELTTKLKKDDLLSVLNQFVQRPHVKQLSEENGLEVRLFHQVFISFRKFCMESETLPADLHIIFSDILQGAGHVDDLFPFFLQHARRVFPHLECMEELKKISDLRLPANWYPEARAINRKIIFHAGPTNSGKTYHALERFSMAKSGVYCGPLKLLAVEVFHKTNERVSKFCYLYRMFFLTLM